MATTPGKPGHDLQINTSSIRHSVHNAHSLLALTGLGKF